MSRKSKDDPNDYWKLPTACTPLDYHVAERIGVYEALVLRSIYQMCHWRKLNKGSDWWQGSYKFWRQTFPWLSTSTFRRIIAKLEKAKLIEIRIDQENGNHYRPVQETMNRLLNDESFSIEEKKQTFVQNEHSHSVQSEQRSFVQNDTPFVQTGTGFVQTEQTLLSLGSLDPSLDPSLDQFATAPAAATEEPANQLAVIEPEVVESSKPSTAETWKVYAFGYERRYGVPPLRNAKVNGQLKQFCERVGYAEAPAIIAFYLTQNDFWYVKQMHTIGIALSEAEKITAAYRRGAMVTKREADYIDKTSSRESFYDRIIDAMDAESAQQGGTT